MNEPIFANGFLFKRNEKAPDFVIGNLSLNVEEAKQFLTDYAKNGWVNLSIKTSKAGKHYIELDTWEPKKDAAAAPQVAAPEPVAAGVDDGQDDLPF